MSTLPRAFRRFQERYPEVEHAHAQLSQVINEQGPLDARARRLVRLGIAIGQGSVGAVKSHARRALEEGFAAEELRQAALLAITTAGFAAAIAATEWVEEVLEEARPG